MLGDQVTFYSERKKECLWFYFKRRDSLSLFYNMLVKSKNQNTSWAASHRNVFFKGGGGGGGAFGVATISKKDR